MSQPRIVLGILTLLSFLSTACNKQSSALASSASTSLRSTSTAVAAAAADTKTQSPAAQQTSSNSNGAPQSPVAVSTPQLEDVETHEGPFQIGGKDYTVSVHYKRIKGTGATGAKSLALIEILDASRQVYFHQAFTPTIENGEFSEMCSPSIEVFPGNMTKFLWITTRCDSDESSSGGPWQLFGPLNGKLVPFGNPIITQGDFVKFVPGPVTKNGSATMFQSDNLEFQVSAGNFMVTIPMRVNLAQGNLDIGIHCFRQTGHGMAESGCDVPVQVERTPVSEEMTFVRMFSEPAENSSTPAHVVIRKDSKVEFLAANVRPTLTPADNFIVLGVTGELWLKVRVDGKEGWIHTQEDFDAIGLPLSG